LKHDNSLLWRKKLAITKDQMGWENNNDNDIKG
jgi:hypothetical protein